MNSDDSARHELVEDGRRTTDDGRRTTDDGRRSVAERLTPPASLDAFVAAAAHDPRATIARLILGERALEWWAATGPLVDPACRAATPPLPPDRLRRIVSDHQPEMFLWTGFVDAALVLEELDRRLPPGPVRFLDFGGGCGRVARHLAAAPGLRLTLADANGEHAAWAASAIPGIAALRCGDLPPLDRPAASFDACLALSVFTHLPAAAYDAWLRELARVLAPGGVLLATLHGADAVARIAETAVLQEYFRLAADDAREILAAVRRPGTFVYRRYDRDQLDAAGAGADYGSTFVSPDEAARRASEAGFDTLEYRAAGLRGWQDLTVLRRR